jgi:secernin
VCDCLVALPPASETAATWFAKNSDRPPDESQQLEWIAPRLDEGSLRATYMDVEPKAGLTLGVLGSRPAWMWGLEHGVNEAGVAIGNEAIFTTLDPHGFPPRLVGMDLVRLGLERAESAEEAVGVMVELLERYGQGGSGHFGRDDPYWSSFLVADGADGWVVETSGRQWEAERVERSRAISNRTTIPSFDEIHRDRGMPTEAVTDPRLAASRAVLAAEPVGLEALETHLRDHDSGEGGFSVCMHVQGYMETVASIVAELGARERPLARVCVGSPCTSIFVPLEVGRPVGEPPPRSRFASLGEEQREGLRQLEAELEADAASCGGSDEWAPYAWRRVEECLGGAGLPLEGGPARSGPEESG